MSKSHLTKNVIEVTEITRFFLLFQSQLRLYHWQTKVFARHKASDELISSVVELSDRFIETLIGKLNARPRLIGSFKKIHDFTDKTIEDYLRECVLYLMNIDIIKDDPALLTIRDELVSAIYKTLYLFTFT